MILGWFGRALNAAVDLRYGDGEALVRRLVAGGGGVLHEMVSFLCLSYE